MNQNSYYLRCVSQICAPSVLLLSFIQPSSCCGARVFGFPFCNIPEGMCGRGPILPHNSVQITKQVTEGQNESMMKDHWQGAPLISELGSV